MVVNLRNVKTVLNSPNEEYFNSEMVDVLKEYNISTNLLLNEKETFAFRPKGKVAHTCNSKMIPRCNDTNLTRREELNFVDAVDLQIHCGSKDLVFSSSVIKYAASAVVFVWFVNTLRSLQASETEEVRTYLFLKNYLRSKKFIEALEVLKASEVKDNLTDELNLLSSRFKNFNPYKSFLAPRLTISSQEFKNMHPILVTVGPKLLSYWSGYVANEKSLPLCKEETKKNWVAQLDKFLKVGFVLGDTDKLFDEVICYFEKALEDIINAKEPDYVVCFRLSYRDIEQFGEIIEDMVSNFQGALEINGYDCKFAAVLPATYFEALNALRSGSGHILGPCENVDQSIVDTFISLWSLYKPPFESYEIAKSI